MSAGGSSGSSDTRFARQGTATTTSFRDLTPQHDSLFQTGFDANNPSSVSPNIGQHINGVLSETNSTIPFQSEVAQIVQANMPGSVTPGQDSLTIQSEIDPYSTGYANNTFDRYKKDVGTALANVSGPLATRGGTAAQGFMGQEVLSDMALNREDVLNRNRHIDAGIQQQASGMLHGMQSRDTQEALSALGQQQAAWQGLLGNQNSAAGVGNQQAGLFSDLVQNYVNLDATVRGVEDNNLTGRGAQTSSATGANVSLCCFIFMEAYDGNMPWWVRKCRDQWAPECSDRRNGYISMSKKLVPWMKKNRFVRWLTKKLMIQPLTKWGGWYHKVEGYEHCEKYAPFVKFWFSVWKHLGKFTNK